MGAMYETITNNINYTTGEVVSSEKTVISKNKKDEYVRFFLESITSLVDAKLTSTEHNVLYAIQKYTTNNSNLLLYNSQTREDIASKIKVKPETVRKAVSKLVTVGILIRNKSLYYLNPIHFGRGDWTEIKKLRKNVETIYDFENLTVTQQDKSTAIYEDPEKIIEELKDAKDVQFIVEQEDKNELRMIEYTPNSNAQEITKEDKKPKLKTLDELFAKSFKVSDKKIINATQNNELRELAYGDLKI